MMPDVDHVSIFGAVGDLHQKRREPEMLCDLRETTVVVVDHRCLILDLPYLSFL
jgi:hypothetical protein